MIDLDQRHTIALEFSCGCRQEWTVSLPPDPDEVTHHSPEACPDPCPSCEAAGRLCAVREGMPTPYGPVQFAEVVPVRRAHYRRMKGK